MHKYILHGLGKKKQGFWAYHLREHHNVCISNNMVDPGYKNIALTDWNTQTKELVVLAVIVTFHALFFIIIPAFTLAVFVSLTLYYYKHRRAHLDPLWAKQHLRWHYDHHLAGNSNANWCVTWPWFDYLMGTRIKNKTLD